MRATEFLADLVVKLESRDLKYALAGSIAAMSYGEPRATLDIDVVIALGESEMDVVASLFPPPEFYMSIDAAREAIRSTTQFNVIHPTSGMKIDFFVVGDAIERSQIARRQRRSILPEAEAWCSPPEELIVKKLAYFSLGGSDKHLRDVGAMLRISPERIDLSRLRELAADHQLEDLLERVLEAVAEG